MMSWFGSQHTNGQDGSQHTNGQDTIVCISREKQQGNALSPVILQTLAAVELLLN